MLQDKQAARTAWLPLLGKWTELDDDDPPTWKKSCSMFTFFITSTEDDIFEFSVHGGDDRVLIDSQKLEAPTFENAVKESDALIAEFVRIGMGVLAVDEIRVVQAFRDPQYSSVLYGVTNDGRLYMNENGGRGWTPVSMKIAD